MLVKVIELVDDEEQEVMHENVTEITEDTEEGILYLVVGHKSEQNFIEVPIDKTEGRAVAVNVVIA